MTLEEVNPYEPPTLNERDLAKQFTRWSIGAGVLLAVGVWYSVQLWNHFLEVALGWGLPIEEWDTTLWLAFATSVGFHFLQQHLIGMLLMLALYIAVRRGGTHRDLSLTHCSMLVPIFYFCMMFLQLFL